MVRAAVSTNREAVHKACETAEVGELNCLQVLNPVSYNRLFLSAAEDQLADPERGYGHQNQLARLGDALAVPRCWGAGGHGRPVLP